MKRHHLTKAELAIIDEWDRKTIENGTARQLAARLKCTEVAVSQARKRLRAKREKAAA